MYYAIKYPNASDRFHFTNLNLEIFHVDIVDKEIKTYHKTSLVKGNIVTKPYTQSLPQEFRGEIKYQIAHLPGAYYVDTCVYTSLEKAIAEKAKFIQETTFYAKRLLDEYTEKYNKALNKTTPTINIIKDIYPDEFI